MKNELSHLLKPLSEVGRARHNVGVVLPMPDLSPRLRECLAALAAALAKAVEQGHLANLYVVIDGRTVDSAAIASTFPVHLVTADFSDLASARAIGARAAVSAGATWLAFTESSALVADSWLIEQMKSESELLLGNVEITNGFMSAKAQAGRSDWDDMTAHILRSVAVNFSNLGMSRSVFDLASHLGGSQLRLDAQLLDQLASLEVATHRCSKPLVYARVQALDEILMCDDTEALRLSPVQASEVRPTHAMAKASAKAAGCLQAAPLATPVATPLRAA